MSRELFSLEALALALSVLGEVTRFPPGMYRERIWNETLGLDTF